MNDSGAVTMTAAQWQALADSYNTLAMACDHALRIIEQLHTTAAAADRVIKALRTENDELRRLSRDMADALGGYGMPARPLH